MEKKINAKSNPLKFFKQYLTLLQPIYGLTPRETDVLSYLLYLNNKFKTIPEANRGNLIMDYDFKVEISDNFNISMPGVYNIISTLRKKNYGGEYFIKGKNINKKVPFIPYEIDNKCSITFNFIIDNEELENNK